MHNPLRSEAEMFRVVVVVGVALLPVIVLGLMPGRQWGAILLGVEIGVAIGALWRTTRGSEPHTAAVATDDDAVYRLLVVANQTVAGQALLSEVQGRCRAHDGCEILVVVPACRPRGSSTSPTTSTARSPRPARGSTGPRGDARGGAPRPRRGRRPPRPQRRDRGRLARLRRRRGDRLDPSARALEVARARGGRAGQERHPAPGHATWSSIWRPRTRPRLAQPEPNRGAALPTLLEQVVDQPLEVLRGERGLEVLGHDVGLVARRDLGVRVDDLLLDVGGVLAGERCRRGPGRWSTVVPAASSAWQIPHCSANRSGGASCGGFAPGTPATLAT